MLKKLPLGHVITWLGISCVAVLSASPLPAVAQQATAWLYAVQVPPWAFLLPGGTTFPLTLGIASQVASPAAAIIGHVPEPGVVGEFAVTQAVITVGDEVPLPTYADGSKAQDSEVFWTVQLWKADFPVDDLSIRHSRYWPGDQVSVTFNGRQLAGAEAHITAGLGTPMDKLQVSVNVFAFRAHDHRRIKPSSSANVLGGPTPAAQPTWGKVKADYRR